MEGPDLIYKVANGRKYYIISRRRVKGRGFTTFVIDHIYELDAREVDVLIDLERSGKAIENLRGTYPKNALLSLIILSILNAAGRVLELIGVKLILKDLILRIIKVSNILRGVSSELSSESVNLLLLSIVSFCIRSWNLVNRISFIFKKIKNKETCKKYGKNLNLLAHTYYYPLYSEHSSSY